MQEAPHHFLYLNQTSQNQTLTRYKLVNEVFDHDRSSLFSLVLFGLAYHSPRFCLIKTLFDNRAQPATSYTPNTLFVV